MTHSGNEDDRPCLPFGDLTGRRAVVTGASSGIGRAIALEFAAAGASVIVHYHQNIAGAKQVVAELQRLGDVSSQWLQADLGEPDQLQTIVDKCWQTGPIDIWVNNAGVDLLTGDGARLSYSAKLQKLLDVDVRASILLSKEVGKRMLEPRTPIAAEFPPPQQNSTPRQSTGVILNIGWDQADRGMEGDSGELFAASKAAVMAFTRSLAVSLAPVVRVNCIAPGWIRTAWGDQTGDYWNQRVLRETPLARWGLPDDIASMARFLASDAAAFLTGQIFNVNGGAVR